MRDFVGFGVNFTAIDIFLYRREIKEIAHAACQIRHEFLFVNIQAGH